MHLMSVGWQDKGDTNVCFVPKQIMAGIAWNKIGVLARA